MMIKHIAVGQGSCGLAAGAEAVERALRAGITGKTTVGVAGCVGLCRFEPLALVTFGDGTERIYVNLDAAKTEQLVKLANGEDNEAESFTLPEREAAALKAQTRVVLANCGRIDPADIDEYIAVGGYEGYKRAKTMTQDDIIAEMKASGLRGRGGAGFPTWLKWDAAKKAAGDTKYVVCNGDEGDPGAFMDRAVLEGDPHAVIEGMLIAARAIGANSGLVYIRAEYPLAVKRFERAIRDVYAKRVIEPLSFELAVKQGAGAFVCGEETALIASLEGQRGNPRHKPPYPAESGYVNRPTNINNVETYANVPFIFREGAAKFASIGAPDCAGTKVFALSGKVGGGGLVETAMGKTLRDVIYNFGGGVKDGKRFKAVQLGGPSGGCLPESLLDTPITYDALAKTGAIMGSGGMVVMDEDSCMVEMARFFLDFTQKESCGKCVQCRVGTSVMLDALTNITKGRGTEGDIEKLSELGEMVKSGALCGLGQTAPNPALSAVKYFGGEFVGHIHDKRCAAKVCEALYIYGIDKGKCVGCGACFRACPVAAVSGTSRLPHSIDADKCVKCGRCASACKFGAVSKVDKYGVDEVESHE